MSTIALEQQKLEVKGMWLGLVGVAIFSLTLPFTRLAVAEINPMFVSMGRAVVAAILAGLMMWLQKARLPQRSELKPLLITACGVVLGFPLLSTFAMHQVPAAHGAIVLGILPLATALFAALRFHERPSFGFWLMAGLGSALVLAFALMQGAGKLQWADFALFGAVVLAAMGYAEGGRLAQSMGGLQVIAWALILISPLTLSLSIWASWQYGLHASPAAWGGFAYVSVFSMFIGFLFWYKGLATGGIARVGQVQLLQPFMSLLGAAVIVGESLNLINILFAVAVIVTVSLGRQMKIHR
ncbi:DMT family transporter [Undibacterium sp. SXout11W]|uniref:DMT family transporter n=1 Tax=Undibacterium sp. SXout11W TaxID=3413050 RepID=UPI003BF37799